jgi:broad specificity phosphatase PhoE
MIVLVRHGETAWSEARKHTGRTDVPLTDEGRRKAATLRERLAGREFALVLTSPLARARETCSLAGLDGAASVDEDLREFDYGAYEGLTTSEIRRERPGWDFWLHDLPGGESHEQAGARADRVIERILAADGDAAVFAHGHILRILGARWLGLEPRGGGMLALSTAAVCELGFERERHVVWLWNDTGHLGGAP